VLAKLANEGSRLVEIPRPKMVRGRVGGAASALIGQGETIACALRVACSANHTPTPNARTPAENPTPIRERPSGQAILLQLHAQLLRPMASQHEGIPVVTESAYLLLAVGAIAAVGDWLGRRRIGRWIGGAIMTLVLAAILANLGVTLPAILVLTTLALVAAQVPAVQRLGGASTLGIYVAYLFLAVIGASCDFKALMEMGHIGGMLLLFVALAVLIHGVIQFGAGRLLRLSSDTLAIASSANVGGAVTIMPIARGLGRMDLLVPGIVVGMLGNAIGTYAGFAMAWFLQAVPSPISAAHAIPPPPEQSTANCTNPTYASDAFVCADKELLALDQRMRSTLVVTSLANAVAPTSLVEDQEAWFKRRSRCAFSERQATCLNAAYSERIVVLAALRAASLELAQSGVSAACRDAPWGSAEVRITLDDHGLAMVMDTEGRVLAVALGKEPRDDWAPFVRFSAEGETVRFSPIDRPSVECHALPSVRR